MLYQPKREKGGIEGRGWEGGLEMDRKGRGGNHFIYMYGSWWKGGLGRGRGVNNFVEG